MATKNYTVTGMTCGHCVNAVRAEVAVLDGVQDVQVDLDSGAVTISSDTAMDTEALTAALDEAGDYKLV